MMKPAVPILRIFDEGKAKEFYQDFLGFSVEWEHRFGENCPLYMQVSKGACVLHLSEHYGDACPGSAVRIETAKLDEFCKALREQNRSFARPGTPEVMPWGNREIAITDPFGNRIVLFEITG